MVNYTDIPDSGALPHPWGIAPTHWVWKVGNIIYNFFHLATTSQVLDMYACIRIIYNYTNIKYIIYNLYLYNIILHELYIIYYIIYINIQVNTINGY